MKRAKSKHQIVFLILITLFLLVFNVLLYKIFSRRSLAFGCFDDCANYMTGYFMLHGKILYKEVSFNHIMGMSWLSYFIQMIDKPINMYDLVLSHRQAIMFIAFVFDLIIIKRFKWTGLAFVVFYELSKFYIFGDRFLGESIIVYASVCLIGLALVKLRGGKLSYFDLIFSGVLAWLIIFTREPFIPLAILLYVIILFHNKNKRKIFFSVLVFLLLTILVFVNTSIQDFYFNVVTVNLGTIFKSEVHSKNLLGSGILSMFLYPLVLFSGGVWNNFRIFEVTISIAFVFGLLFELFKRKKRFVTAISVIFLGAANIRVTPAGTVFYEAYHMIVWFGIFLFITLLFVSDVFKTYKKIGATLFFVIFVGWGIAVFSPASYLFDKLDLQEQLLTNFGTAMNVGNVVRELSNPKDTLFLDGAEDMIYWQSQRFSSYKYSWYTSVMPKIPLYAEARIEMFKNSPPDFYYDYCSKEAPLKPSLPRFVLTSYQQLYSNGKPSCLYIKKTKLGEISLKQWKKAQEGFYSLSRLTRK